MYGNVRLLCAIAAVAMSLAAPAWADTYAFEHIIDEWTVFGIDAVPVLEGHPLSYQHDLTGKVDFATGDEILEASLELDFTNDATDGRGSTAWGLIRWDHREYAKVAFDGTGWIDVAGGAEIDDGQYEAVLDIDWLNDDGLLDVTIAAHNPRGTATLWLDHSRVYGTARQPVATPVPGAALLGMLGLCAAGLRLRRSV